MSGHGACLPAAPQTVALTILIDKGRVRKSEEELSLCFDGDMYQYRQNRRGMNWGGDGVSRLKCGVGVGR